MAILTATQLAEMRQRLVKKLGIMAIDFDKPTVNAAFQAIEDWYEANKGQISSDINTATAPFVFTPQQKKWLGAYWLLQKSKREDV